MLDLSDPDYDPEADFVDFRIKHCKRIIKYDFSSYYLRDWIFHSRFPVYGSIFKPELIDFGRVLINLWITAGWIKQIKFVDADVNFFQITDKGMEL